LENWKSYEEVATYLLNNFANYFGLTRVEGKQKLPGMRSGTSYEIDAKGIRYGQNEGFIIVECRRYTNSRQNQENIGALAYRIIDTGAAGGIIVSPLGLQKGAAKVADNEHIIEVCLNATCTSEEFVMKFLDKLMIGIRDGVTLGETIVVAISRNCKGCGSRFHVTGNETLCNECQHNKKE